MVWVAPNDRLMLQLYGVQHRALSMLSHSQQAMVLLQALYQAKWHAKRNKRPEERLCI